MPDSTFPLHKAAAAGDLPALELLISQGAAVNASDEDWLTPLDCAIGGRASAESRVELVEYLIAKGADFQSEDIRGVNPLSRAARKGDLAIVELLIRLGSDPASGAALSAAVEMGHAEVARSLIAHGADVDEINGYGDRPLMVAVQGEFEGRAELVELLIDAGADVNAGGATFETPLHWAARFGKLRSSQLLIAHGVDLNAEDASGQTALDAVRECESVRTLLIEAGGRRAQDSPLEIAIAQGDWNHAVVRERMEIREQAAGLAELGRRLRDRGSSVERFNVPAEDAESAPPPVDERDFQGRFLKAVERPVRRYAVTGYRTRITMLEEEVADREALRRSRLSSGGAPPDPKLLHRALPEDFIPALESLPDSELIRDLWVVLRLPNAEDRWHAIAAGDPFFVSQASTWSNGRITFYRKDRDFYLGDELRHEWAHLYRWQNDLHVRTFDLAAEYEKHGYHLRSRAEVNLDENWAVHLGESFLSPRAEDFFELTQEAPMRAVALGESLATLVMRGTLPRSRAYFEALRVRLRYVRDVVRPAAVATLVEDIATAPRAEEQRIPVRLLVRFGEAGRLAGIPSLTSVDLSGERVGAAQLEALRDATSVEELDLSNTRVDRYVDFVVKMPLKRLRLSGTKVASLYGLAHLQNLEELDLSYTAIQFCHPLKPLAGTLRYLNIEGTDVAQSEEMVAELKQMLPHCRIVH